MLSMLISLGYLPKQIRGSVCCLIANPTNKAWDWCFSFVIFRRGRGRVCSGLTRVCFSLFTAPPGTSCFNQSESSEQIGRIAQFAQHFSQFRNQNHETNQATTLNSMLPVFQYHSGKPKANEGHQKVTKNTQLMKWLLLGRESNQSIFK